MVQLTLPTELVHTVDRWAARETRRRLGARVSRSQAVRELLSFALAARQPVRVYRLGEEPPVDETEHLTPEARVAMMGELARTADEMRGETVVPGIRRDLVRVALLKNKRAAGRPQDLADVTNLERTSRGKPRRPKR